MSTVDLESLRQRTREAGDRLGWAPFGHAVGIDGETLRAFAKGASGRRVHPKTAAALERYFAPPVGELEAKAVRALALMEEGHALLTEIVQAVRALPDADPAAIITQTAKAALFPTPPATGSGRPESGAASRRIARPSRTPDDG